MSQCQVMSVKYRGSVQGAMSGRGFVQRDLCPGFVNKAVQIISGVSDRKKKTSINDLLSRS